ncbi:hypothetical protein V8E51_002911 [Hyaloscypha variabilis]
MAAVAMQRAQLKRKSEDPVPIEDAVRPNLQNPQSVVTVFVTSKPAPPQRQENGESSAPTTRSASPDRKKFTIHKDFICFYSPFFASAFNGPYKEGQTQIMSLYEIDPEVFGIFVYWLYHRKLPTHTARLGHVDLVHLAKLWILGDRFLAPALQNNAICRMHTIIGEGRLEGFEELVTMAYNYREGHNEMTKLAVWTVVTEDQAFFDKIWQGSGFPPAMALEVMKVLKTHYEGLPLVRKLAMPPNDNFRVKEYTGRREVGSEME